MKYKNIFMVKFNLERAKAGDPVETRSGKKVRILCFDKKGSYSIVALVDDDDSGEERIESFTLEGTYTTGPVSSFDLVMAPKGVVVKYVIVYSDGSISDPLDTYEEAHNKLVRFYGRALSKSIAGKHTIGKIEYEI